MAVSTPVPDSISAAENWATCLLREYISLAKKDKYGESSTHDAREPPVCIPVCLRVFSLMIGVQPPAFVLGIVTPKHPRVNL